MNLDLNSSTLQRWCENPFSHPLSRDSYPRPPETSPAERSGDDESHTGDDGSLRAGWAQLKYASGMLLGV